MKILPFLMRKTRGFFNWMPDSLYLRMIFRAELGYSLDLNNPKTYNEKIQWLKLYDHNPLYTQLVDKYEVRKFITEKVGEEYLIPLLGIWDRIEDIDFDNLPNQFVLKCTHDSGSVIICKDKNCFDIKTAKEKLKKSLSKNFYYKAREWSYKNVKPKIVCEKYMVDESAMELKNYKVFCFNGEPKFIQVDYDRFTNHKRNLYDLEWSYIPVTIAYPTDSNKILDKPVNLEKMLDLARILSKSIPHVRVDFYSINMKIYFGELTFYHGAGLETIKPVEFDIKMGNWLELPKPIQTFKSIFPEKSSFEV